MKPPISQDTINSAILALANKIEQDTGIELNDSVYMQIEDEVASILDQQFNNTGYNNYN